MFRLMRENQVTEKRFCRPMDHYKYFAQTYLTYLRSSRKQDELTSKYFNKGDRSIEESARLVGLKLPKQDNTTQWSMVVVKFAWAIKFVQFILWKTLPGYYDRASLQFSALLKLEILLENGSNDNIEPSWNSEETIWILESKKQQNDNTPWKSYGQKMKALKHVS